MNKDYKLLAEAYSLVQESATTEIIKKGINMMLDIVEKRFPELYQKIVAVNSPEELKALLTAGEPQHESLNEGVIDVIKNALQKLYAARTTPAAVTALSSLLFIDFTAAAGMTDSTTTAGQAAVIGTGVVASAVGALYGIIKARSGWSKPIDGQRSGSDIMASIEQKRKNR
jgi:adenylosuccinate synthase